MDATYDLISIGFSLVSLLAWIWLTVRLWSATRGGAVATFFLGLPAFYFLAKYWNDKEHDIRIPFFVNVAIIAAFFLVFLGMPTYKFEGKDAMRSPYASSDVSVRPNPEMERWCRENHDATYSPALGTCIEKDPNQANLPIMKAPGLIEQLGSHFVENGLETRITEVDESMAGAERLEEIPGISRVAQYELKSRSLTPSLVLVGECQTSGDCERIAMAFRQPGAPFEVAQNGKLLLFVMPFFGETQKIERAKQAFTTFAAL